MISVWNVSKGILIKKFKLEDQSISSSIREIDLSYDESVLLVQTQESIQYYSYEHILKPKQDDILNQSMDDPQLTNYDQNMNLLPIQQIRQNGANFIKAIWNHRNIIILTETKIPK